MIKNHLRQIKKEKIKTKSPRKYWNTIKTRKSELSSICRQLKLKAKDGKFYNTDVVDSYYYETEE